MLNEISQRETNTIGPHLYMDFEVQNKTKQKIETDSDKRTN